MNSPTPSEWTSGTLVGGRSISSAAVFPSSTGAWSTSATCSSGQSMSPPGFGGEERHEHSSCRFAFDLHGKRKPFARVCELGSSAIFGGDSPTTSPAKAYAASDQDRTGQVCERAEEGATPGVGGAAGRIAFVARAKRKPLRETWAALMRMEKSECLTTPLNMFVSSFTVR
jgi:hypothetical protein